MSEPYGTINEPSDAESVEQIAASDCCSLSASGEIMDKTQGCIRGCSFNPMLCCSSPLATSRDIQAKTLLMDKNAADNGNSPTNDWRIQISRR